MPTDGPLRPLPTCLEENASWGGRRSRSRFGGSSNGMANVFDRPVVNERSAFPAGELFVGEEQIDGDAFFAVPHNLAAFCLWASSDFARPTGRWNRPASDPNTDDHTDDLGPSLAC